MPAPPSILINFLLTDTYSIVIWLKRKIKVKALSNSNHIWHICSSIMLVSKNTVLLRIAGILISFYLSKGTSQTWNTEKEVRPV